MNIRRGAMRHSKRLRILFATGEPVPQAELTRIFELLSSGGVVENWGTSAHREYDSLFNQDSRLWERRKTSPIWVERLADTASGPVRGRNALKVRGN